MFLKQLNQGKFEKSAPEQLLRSSLWHICTRGGHGPGVPRFTPEGFCVFSDPVSESKSEPESLYNVVSNISLRGHFLIENMVKFRLDGW